MDPRRERVRAIVLSLVERCAVCGQQVGPEDLQALGRTRPTRAFRLICHSCGAYSLIAAVSGEQEFAATPARSNREPVTERDVAEIQTFLEHFDGDFQRLFGYSGHDRSR